ncbi:kinase-like domain-containing protein, partial [Daedaleopsis nitida]
PTALKPSLDSKPPNVSHQSDRVSSQARPSDDAPASPTKISMEQFTIIRELGNGAYGVVYLVQDRVTKKISALKTVSKGTSVEQDGSYSSIRKEQAILERLGVDSAFVNLQASWEDDTYFYFLMDYYSGGDLFDKLRMYGPIPEPQAKRYFAQLLLAVEKLQKLRIIHCDIKVENILFSSNDDAILADFGLAAEFGRTPAQSSAHDEDDHLDKFAGDWVEICGTGLYFSPLVLSTFKMTYNSDLWALAVVLYAMLLDKVCSRSQPVGSVYFALY